MPAVERPAIQAWAQLLGLQAAQAIYPLQRRVIRLMGVNIVFMTVLFIVSTTAGRYLRAPVPFAIFLGVLIALTGSILTAVVVSAVRNYRAQRQIARNLGALGHPVGTVPVMSLAASRRWMTDRGIPPELVARAINAWAAESAAGPVRDNA